MNNNISFQIISDVHLEFRHGKYEIKPVGDYLALLGDIGVCLNDKNDKLGNDLEKFIDVQCKNFKGVWYVMGNHESYGSSLDTSITFFRRIEKKHNNFFFLNQDTFDIPNTDIRILGTTLWSFMPDKHKTEINWSLNDLTQISGFDFDTYRKQHLFERDWISKEIGFAVKENKKVIVFTHHCPTTIKQASPESEEGYYCEIELGIGCSDLSKLFSENVLIWAFGHTHWNIDQNVNGTRVVSNQVCYPNDPYFKEKNCIKYNPDQVFYI